MPALMPRASTLLKAAIAAGAAIATGLLLSQCGQPKASANGFDVALSFTPAASAKLKALGRKAVVDAYFYGLPTEATADDIAALRSVGMNDIEIIDLIHAISIFGWANRLMHVLGHAEPGQ